MVMCAPYGADDGVEAAAGNAIAGDTETLAWDAASNARSRFMSLTSSARVTML